MHDWTHASTLPPRARLHIRPVHAFMRHVVIKHTRNRRATHTRTRTLRTSRILGKVITQSKQWRAEGAQDERTREREEEEEEREKQVELERDNRWRWIYRGQSTRWVGFTASMQHNCLSTPKKKHSNYSLVVSVNGSFHQFSAGLICVCLHLLGGCVSIFQMMSLDKLFNAITNEMFKDCVTGNDTWYVSKIKDRKFRFLGITWELL